MKLQNNKFKYNPSATFSISKQANASFNTLNAKREISRNNYTYTQDNIVKSGNAYVLNTISSYPYNNSLRSIFIITFNITKSDNDDIIYYKVWTNNTNFKHIVYFPANQHNNVTTYSFVLLADMNSEAFIFSKMQLLMNCFDSNNNVISFADAFTVNTSISSYMLY